jgi:tetratricopeptide (TPR) repeat protein
MIGLIIKLGLSLGSLAFTTWLFATGSWGWGIVFIFVTGVVILSIFRNQNILLAALQMRQQNVEKAKKYLNRIKQPQYLIRGQRAYFFYLSALVNQESTKMSATEASLRKALNVGLNKDHDQAMAKINIAAICMQTGRRREAETLLSEAKKLDTKGVMSEYIKGLKKQMGRTTSRNQLRMAQMNKGKKVASKKQR